MRENRRQAIPERIRQARHEAGLTQEQASERARLSRNTIAGYENKRFRPSESSLTLLGVLYDKPYEWFYGEEEEPKALPAHGEADLAEYPTRPAAEPQGAVTYLDQVRQEFRARFDRLETYIRAQASVQAIDESRANYDPSNYGTSDRNPVRLLEVTSAAGVGAEVYDETPIGLLWFRNDWLRSHSIDPEQSNIISVRGASMEPTLPDGCSILVDRKRREPQEGRIYVMRTEDGLVVKRLGLDEEGRWEIRSDSPDWRITPMSPGTEIIGEVRWSAVTH